MRAYAKGIANYFEFQGRTSRSDFWMFYLQLLIISMVVQVIDHALQLGSLLVGIVSFFHLLPNLAIQVRRLHDTNRSGWWLLLCFTIIGAIPLLVWCMQQGTPGENNFDTFEAVFPMQSEAVAATSGSGMPRVHGDERQTRQMSTRVSLSFTRVALTCAGITFGFFLLADAQGLRPLAWLISQGPSCSSESVTSLTAKLLKDTIAKSAMMQVVDISGTTVRIEAIRTQSATATTSQCLARAVANYAFKTPVSAEQQAAALQELDGWSSLDIAYQAELTDDGKQVFVTIHPQTN